MIVKMKILNFKARGDQMMGFKLNLKKRDFTAYCRPCQCHRLVRHRVPWVTGILLCLLFLPLGVWYLCIATGKDFCPSCGAEVTA